MANIRLLTTADIARELRRLLRRGLPTTREQAGDVLPHLRSVIARAVHPSDDLSRVDSLNLLLPKLVEGIQHERYGPCARILLCLSDGTRGTTLTLRRNRCAEFLHCDDDHFRKRIEPAVLMEVATAIHRDLLRYKGRERRSTDGLEPTGATPRLTEADLTAEEELISRIWQHVYGLRAELICALRFDAANDPGTAEEHRQEAERLGRTLKLFVRRYVATYGDTLIRHGDLEYSVEALARLAEWQP